VLSDLGVCGGADGEEEDRSPCGAASELKGEDTGCEVQRGTHARERERESESEKTIRKEEKRRNLGFRASKIKV
jgi:hypothetical protein